MVATVCNMTAQSFDITNMAAYADGSGKPGDLDASEDPALSNVIQFSAPLSGPGKIEARDALIRTNNQASHNVDIVAIRWQGSTGAVTCGLRFVSNMSDATIVYDNPVAFAWGDGVFGEDVITVTVPAHTQAGREEFWFEFYNPTNGLTLTRLQSQKTHIVRHDNSTAAEILAAGRGVLVDSSIGTDTPGGSPANIYETPEYAFSQSKTDLTRHILISGGTYTVAQKYPLIDLHRDFATEPRVVVMPVPGDTLNFTANNVDGIDAIFHGVFGLHSNITLYNFSAGNIATDGDCSAIWLQSNESLGAYSFDIVLEKIEAHDVEQISAERENPSCVRNDNCAGTIIHNCNIHGAQYQGAWMNLVESYEGVDAHVTNCEYYDGATFYYGKRQSDLYPAPQHCLTAYLNLGKTDEPHTYKCWDGNGATTPHRGPSGWLLFNNVAQVTNYFAGAQDQGGIFQSYTAAGTPAEKVENICLYNNVLIAAPSSWPITGWATWEVDGMITFNNVVHKCDYGFFINQYSPGSLPVARSDYKYQDYNNYSDIQVAVGNFEGAAFTTLADAQSQINIGQVGVDANSTDITAQFVTENADVFLGDWGVLPGSANEGSGLSGANKGLLKSSVMGNY